MGVPHRRPTFLQIGTTKRGRVLEDTVWGQGPCGLRAHQALRPGEGRPVPRQRGICLDPPAPRSWLGREAPSLRVPSLLHAPRPRGRARTQARPLWAPPPPADAPRGWTLGRGRAGPQLSAYRSGHQDHKQPPGNPADAGSWGQETQQPSGLRRPAGPRWWQCQPARQPSPPRPSPHAGRPQAGREPGPQLLPHLGSGPQQGGQRPPPSRLAAAGRGAGRGGGGGSGGTRPPTPQPLSCQGEPGTPVPGLGWLSRPAWLQGRAGPKQRPARGPHPALPTPASPRGLRDLQVPRGDAGTALAHRVLYSEEGGGEGQPLPK